MMLPRCCCSSCCPFTRDPKIVVKRNISSSLRLIQVASRVAPLLMSGMSIRQANERDAAAAAAAEGSNGSSAGASRQKLLYAAAVVALVAIAVGSYTYFNSAAPKRSKEGKSKPFFADKPPPIDAPAGSRLNPSTPLNLIHLTNESHPVRSICQHAHTPAVNVSARYRVPLDAAYRSTPPPLPNLSTPTPRYPHPTPRYPQRSLQVLRYS